MLNYCNQDIFAPDTGALYIAPMIGAMAKFRSSVHSPEWLLLIDWLVQKRKQANLSQRQLAANIGVVRSLVGKVEKGERRLDPLEMVVYCEAMNADPTDLVKVIRREMRRRSQ